MEIERLFFGLEQVWETIKKEASRGDPPFATEFGDLLDVVREVRNEVRRSPLNERWKRRNNGRNEVWRIPVAVRDLACRLHADSFFFIVFT